MPFPLEEPFGEDWETVKRNFRKLAGGMNPPVPQARVYHSTGQSIPNTTETTLLWDTERWDTGDLHSTSSNTGRLTAPITGLYEAGLNVRFASNPTGYRYAYIWHQPSNVLVAIASQLAINGLGVMINVGGLVRLAQGEYIEARVWQNSGGALVNDASPGQTEFWMHRVGGYVNQGV